MTSSRLLTGTLGLAVLAATSAPTVAESKGELKGPAEFRKADILVVDGQRVRLVPETKFKGGPAGTDVPLGYDVKVSGSWRTDGSLLAKKIESKPNRRDSKETELVEKCNEIEQIYAQAGRAIRVGDDGTVLQLGPVADSGPEHKRARKILDRLLPPYLGPGDVRLYVVNNPEWNAFAMANFAIFVHTGLLKDLDDDEVAIVIGHELAHATLEHTRRSMSKGRWARWAGGIAVVGGAVLGGVRGDALAGLTGLGAGAVNSNFSRDFEDQADRVGIRYAFEGGFSPHKAPQLWRRFGEKYRDGGRVGNFLFGSHSRSADRAKNLEAELARNYAMGLDTPSRALAGPPKR